MRPTVPVTRRQLLSGLAIGSAALLSAACGTSVNPRPTPVPSNLTPEFTAWDQEIHGMLMDALATLRTYDTYQAFRVAGDSQSSRRGAAELAWDPPSMAAWNEATHVTGGLRNRAEQVLNSISASSARADSSLWRERRAFADNVHELLGLGERLAAYRARLDVLAPGDASGALGLLDQVWAQWDTAAAPWGLARAESIACARAGTA